eukprot:m.187080 g.187080  ORF g.187080 m.187080 type:complete len:302 (+) comp17515_c0_seq6:177-1082(+)
MESSSSSSSSRSSGGGGNRSAAHKSSVSLAAGSTSGLLSAVLLQPLDVVKTRLQLRPETRRALRSVVAEITATQGLPGFWNGLRPSVARAVPGVGLYFATLQAVSSVLKERTHLSSGLQDLLAGGMSRCVSVSLLMPVTVVKARMESGRFSHYSKSVISNLALMARTEGLKSWFAGTVPTILRDAPFSATYLFVYHKMKTVLEGANAASVIPAFAISMTAGLTAGVTASVVTQPQDLIKTLVQTDASGAVSMSVAMRQATSTGVRGLAKGLLPRVMRRSLMSAVTWSVYEQLVATFDTVLP